MPSIENINDASIPTRSLQDVREELVEGEAEGAEQEAEVGGEDEDAASGKPLLRNTTGVAQEVLDASHGVDGAQNRCDNGELEAAQEERHQKGRKEFQGVLVSSLHTVERLCVLVALGLAGIHGGVGHMVPLASHPNLRKHANKQASRIVS